MKKELFNSLEASTRTNHPSPAFQAHKRTRSLAEIRGARQPAPSLPRRLPTKHARRPKGRTTPRKEARRRGRYEWHRHLQGDARAAAVNARRRRRRRRAARNLRRRWRPWLHCRRRVPVLRFARRACERRRGQQWPWPVFVPGRTAGAACTQQNRWRAPSAGLPPQFARRCDDVQPEEGASLAEVQ